MITVVYDFNYRISDKSSFCCCPSWLMCSLPTQCSQICTYSRKKMWRLISLKISDIFRFVKIDHLFPLNMLMIQISFVTCSNLNPFIKTNWFLELCPFIRYACQGMYRYTYQSSYFNFNFDILFVKLYQNNISDIKHILDTQKISCNA